MPKVELAAAVVVLDNRVLIVRRSKKEGFLPRQWGVPCGKIDTDTGEDARHAVLRELEEETGLTGSVIRYAGRLEFQSNWLAARVNNIQYNYLVKPIIGPSAQRNFAGRPKVKMPRRDQRAKWVRAGRIGRVGLDPHNLKTVRQALGAGHAALAGQFAE